MRSVLYVSGTRADYGPARRVLSGIDAAPDLDLGIVVTGMHLHPLHGETWREIEEDGFAIVERVACLSYERDSLAEMVCRVGDYLQGLSRTFERLKPDIVLVLGDRGEALAGAMAAAFQNIVVVHLCGGSLSGSIDDAIRHAITKFSHYHLVASNSFARRVRQLGEHPDTVEVVGLPGGDLRPEIVLSRDDVATLYGLDPREAYLLVIQHPVTHTQHSVSAQIEETLEATLASGLPTCLANPNDDAGGHEILRVMRAYAAQHRQLRIVEPPRSREHFASLMGHSAALVGNSSSGTVEATSIRLPVVNVGDRQQGREAYGCMINVGYQRDAIETAIAQAIDPKSDYRHRLNAFQSELIRDQTAERVVAALRRLDLRAGSRPKVFKNLEQAEG